MAYHKLLQRQIRKYLGADALKDPVMLKFVEAVHNSYNSFDRDKELYVHSFQISEREYQQVNEDLMAEVMLKKLSIAKLKKAIKKIDHENEIELHAESDDLLVVVDYLNHQINKRKLIEEKLRDLSLVSEETSNMVIIADARRHIVWVNNAFLQTSGYTFDEVVGKKPGEVLQGPDTNPNTVREIRDALAEGKSFHGLLLNYSKQGSPYWNELSINPIRDEAGNVVKFISIATDVTERIKKNIELANRASQFKGLSENIPAVIYEYQFNKDGTEAFRYISPAIEKIMGVTAETFARDAFTYIHPDDRPRFIEKNEHARDTHEPFSDITRMMIPGKGLRWQAVASSYTYETPEGAAVYTGIISDITGEKHAEEALKVNEEKYRGMITNMQLGLVEMDNLHVITYANQAFCDMSGFQQPELIGRKPDRLFKITTQSNHTQADACEIKIIDKAGRHRWWFISTAPHKNDKGQQIGYVRIHLDITQQKHLEENLVKAREEAISLANTKETFLANMSHEIRTPLNGIIGMIRELAKMNLSTQQEMYVKYAGSASQHLLSIINNILDLSKIEAGVFDLEKKSFSLQHLLREVEGMMKGAVMEKMLQTNYTVAPELANRFMGDSLRIRQVLLNILSNCIKFTEKGFVNVACTAKAAAPDTQQVTIVITDSGIGMDDDFLKNIFNKFTQENDSIQRKYGGTGLGMAITYELLQLMKGSIHVISTRGQGSKFEISLPLAIDHHYKETEETTVDYHSLLAGKRILLVDDNEMNRLVVVNLLSHYHTTMVEAVHGEEAITLLSSQIFDIILMDLQMPRMDGFETTRWIRRHKITTPIIALTANAFKSEIDKCMDAGMNDFVTKPFDEDVFIRTLMANLPYSKKSQPSVKQEAPPPAVTAVTQELYNLTRVHTMSRGNQQFIQRMLQMFTQQATDFIASLQHAVTAQDLPTLNKIAHKIKPAIHDFGITTLKDDIAYLETVPTFQPDIPTRVAHIQNILQQVLQKIETPTPINK